ncbi:MAG: epoxyqueuosine reductase QueH [Thermodesulfovibrionales bacterium]
MKILMHICCSNCALYPLQTLRRSGSRTVGLWYNPNIHPFDEYRSRLQSLRALQEQWGLEIEYAGAYGSREFLSGIKDPHADRCGHCYSLRMEETARTARSLGFDAFTSTLLVSPFQKFSLVVQAGQEMAQKHNVEFLAVDFRPGYREAMHLSRELGLYRQKYCGCIYSEIDRYAGRRDM